MVHVRMGPGPVKPRIPPLQCREGSHRATRGVAKFKSMLILSQVNVKSKVKTVIFCRFGYDEFA